MPNENFRRELNQVFDDVAGSPSAALPDRVRSSLKEVPEQRGPFWIAGVAAALIAVIVVGVLVVANFNRHPTGVVPAGQPSPSPSASPTPGSDLQPFVCVSTGLGTAPAPPVVFVSDVRTGTHAGYDRLTIEFTNGRPGTVELRTQTGTSFTQGASGQPMTLAGKNGILVTFRGADLHTSYKGSTDVKTGYATLIEVRQVQDFEGVVQLGLGVSGATCYRAFILTNPTRLVIDIEAG